MARKLVKGGPAKGNPLTKSRQSSGGASLVSGKGFATQSGGSRGGRKLTLTGKRSYLHR